MVNRVYLIPGKNIVIWDSWTPLILENNKVVTPNNTTSITRYDNGIPVVYQVGASNNPKNFTQLIKNVTYFIEVKTAYWLNNAVSQGTAAQQSPTPTPTPTPSPTPSSTPTPTPSPTPAPAPTPTQAPTPTPTPVPSPVPDVTPGIKPEQLEAAKAELENLLGVEAANRKEGDRNLLSQLQTAIEVSQPSNENLSSISKIACTTFGLGFLALENSQQGKDKIGALNLEDLNKVLDDLRLLISGKQPLSDALSLLSSIGISNFAIRLLTLDNNLELRKLIDFDQLAVPLLSELDSKQPLNEQLSAIALLSTTDFGLGLLTLADVASARNRIGAAAREDLQGYAKLAGDGTIPTSLLPNQSLVNIASVNSAQEMLGLTDIQPGDVVIRRDLSTRKIFTLLSLPASDLGNWERTGIGVQTLNGQSGPVVNLAAADVGADEVGSANRVNQLLVTHQTDLNNPHRVTVAQIKAEPAGSVREHEQSVNHPVATSRFNGFMSAADKAKLDSISPDSFTSRKTTVFKTDLLAAQQIGNYSIPLAKSFNLLRVEVSSACRLRIYSSPGYRAADSARAIGAQLKPGNGLISEVVFAGQLAYDLDSTFGSSAADSDALSEAVPKGIAFAVTNTGAAAAITLTLTYLKLE